MVGPRRKPNTDTDSGVSSPDHLINTFFTLVKKKKKKEYFYNDLVQFISSYSQKRFLEEVCKATQKPLCATQRVSGRQNHLNRKIQVGLSTQDWDNMSQGYCQNADLKESNMDINKGCSHFPDILSNTHGVQNCRVAKGN